jgi:hypothetical protein
MTKPSTETDQQARTAAHEELLRAILAWEAFKVPTLHELLETRRVASLRWMTTMENHDERLR